MQARGIGETGPLVERRDHGIDRPDPTFLASMTLQPRERDRSPLQGKTSRQITASEVTMGKSHGKRGCCQKERVAGFGRAAHRRTGGRARLPYPTNKTRPTPFGLAASERLWELGRAHRTIPTP